MTIEEGEVFSCFVFSSMSERQGLAAEIELRPGVWVSRGLPTEPQDHWREWLGSLTMRDLKSRALVLTAKSKQAQGDALQTDLNLLWYGFLLQGVPDYKRGFHFAGANEGRGAQIKQFGNLEKSLPTVGLEFGPQAFFVGSDEVHTAGILAERLARVNQKGPNWSRFRRGLYSLFDGGQEWRYQDERLHRFVRSLEALILPARGQTRNQFVRRCGTSVKATAAAREALAARGESQWLLEGIARIDW
jgi:hypothetical protein